MAAHGNTTIILSLFSVWFLALLCLTFTSQIQIANGEIQHGGECNATGPEQCQKPFSCIHVPNLGAYRCVCSEKQFYYTPDKKCLTETNLKVTITKFVTDTNSITVSWSGLPAPSIRYSVECSGCTYQISDNSATITNLTPGNKYTLTVRAEYDVKGDDLYNEKTITSSVSDTKWTKPAAAGGITDVIRVSKTENPPFEYELYFKPSAGKVSRYEMRLNNVTCTSVSLNTKFICKSLVPGSRYQYIITSYNGAHEPTETSGSAWTPPEQSSKVTNVKIKPAAHSATIKWAPPEFPNGNISRYEFFAKSLRNDGIFYFDCQSNITTGNPASNQASQGTTQNCSTTQFKNSSIVEIKLQDLQPYNNYSIIIFAVNEKGEGLEHQDSFRTEMTAANNVTNITLVSARDPDTRRIHLTISWTSGAYAGPTFYNVTVEKKINSSKNEFQISDLHGNALYDLSNTSVVLNDVLAHWTYRVSVKAYTEAGSSAAIVSDQNTTVANNPGVVRNLYVLQDERDARTFRVEFSKLEVNEQNGTNITYVIKQTLLSSNGEEVPVTNYSTDGHFWQSEGVKVGQNYTFSVMARNKHYNGSFSNETTLMVVARKPHLLTRFPSSSELVHKSAKPQTDDPEITMTVCAKCLLNDDQGDVLHVGLIVCVNDDRQMCRNSITGDTKYETFVTWRESMRKDFNVPYRTTPDDWKMHLRCNSNDCNNYNVGVDTNCVTNNVDHTCNGPLPDGRNIVIFVAVCTDAGCDYVHSENIFVKKRPEESVVKTVVAILLSILALILLVCLIIVLFFRRIIPKRVANFLWKETIKEPEVNLKRPIKIRDFVNHVQTLHKDSNLLFQSEFEDIGELCMTFKYHSNEAHLEANRIKNRYGDIIPYDHSRVRLDVQSEDTETNDFINANYIPGINSVREYIATQGPMHCTVPDFWRMAWEQKCHVIVMLSDLQENGKLKVDQYWPTNLNEPVNYENVVVEMKNCAQINKYVKRNFKITKGKETRNVSQYFLPGWLDFSANLSFDDVLQFVKLIRSEMTPDMTGPIIVHCSAGVGRTGTLIALDYFMQYVDKHSLDDEVDIFNYVIQMRKNRPRMVQAEGQYIFIYDAVLEMIKTKMASKDVGRPNVCGNSQNGKIGQQANVQIEDDKCTFTNEAFEQDNTGLIT